MTKQPSLEGAIHMLKEQGYDVRPNGFVKKTFDIKVDILAKANEIRVRREMTMRDMFSEALQLWIKKYQDRSSKGKA